MGRPLAAIALGAGVAVLVSLSTLGLPLHERLELLTLDLRFRWRSPPPASPKIVHVDLDDRSIAELGRWPWDRHVHARFLDMAEILGAKRVVFDVEFSEPQRAFVPAAGAERAAAVAAEHARRHGESLAGLAKDLSDSRTTPAQAAELLKVVAGGEEKLTDQVRSVLAEETLDYDRVFVEAIRRRKGTLVGYTAKREGKPEKGGDLLAGRASFGAAGPGTSPALELVAPILSIQEAASGFGVTTIEPDRDGVTRRVALLWNYGGKLLPQLGFRAALDELGVEPGKISVEPGRIRAGGREIPVDAEGRAILDWRAGPPGELWAGMFPHVSYVEVYRYWEDLDALDRLFAGLEAKWPRKVLFGRRNGLRKGLDASAESLKNLRDEEAELVRLLRTQIADRERSGPSEEERRWLGEARELLEKASKRRELAIQREEMLRKEFRERTTWFVGASYVAATDFQSCPLDPREKIPGVTIHSTVFNMMEQGRFISPLSVPLTAALALLLGGLAVAAAMRLNALLGALAVALGVAAWAAACHVLFTKGTWLGMVGPSASAALSFAAVTVFRSFYEEKDKRKIRRLFEHYVDPTLVERLVADPSLAGMGGAAREGTVLFADVANFTRYSFLAKPEEAVAFVNGYLSMGTDVILAQGGYLDKYMGDGLMAVFGAPLGAPGHAVRACLSALEMQTRAPDCVGDFEQKVGLPFKIRVGLASGHFIVGNVGSRDRVSYTAIGDTVNLASRLQTAGKELNLRMLCNEETALVAGGKIETRDLGLFKVRGREAGVRVHEILAPEGGVSQALREFRKWFDDGLRAHFEHDWTRAFDAFSHAAALMPEDKATLLYLKLAGEFRKQPPDKLDPIPL